MAPGTVCTAPVYRRREPEKTGLHRALALHLETFLERVHARGSFLPCFVERELRDFLACGILVHGFCRVRCTACGKEALVGFS